MELAIRDLVAGYGRHRVLDGVTVAPLTGGRVVGVLGPNGSGKSTFMQTVAGLHPVRSGEVSLLVDAHVAPPRARRGVIGYVPQGLPESAALRAFEAVLITSRREAVANPVEHTAEVMHRLGMDAYAHRYLSELSGGQRQLVALAQMMVGTPALMLLDEPTSALDLHHQLFVLETVRKKAHEDDSLALVAIHDINLACRMCDELIVLHRGEILAQGVPSEVITPELIEQVYAVKADILQHCGVPIVAAHAVTKTPTMGENDRKGIRH